MSDIPMTKDELSEFITQVVMQTIGMQTGRNSNLDDIAAKVDRLNDNQRELAEAIKRMDETLRGNGKPGIRQRLDTFEVMAQQSHDVLFGSGSQPGMRQRFDRVECEADQSHLSLHGDEKVRGVLDRTFILEDRLSGFSKVFWTGMGATVSAVVVYFINSFILK